MKKASRQFIRQRKGCRRSKFNQHCLRWFIEWYKFAPQRPQE